MNGVISNKMSLNAPLEEMHFLNAKANIAKRNSICLRFQFDIVRREGSCTDMYHCPVHLLQRLFIRVRRKQLLIVHSFLSAIP